MGQTTSTASCAQTCKDWSEKDYSTVKVDLAAIHQACADSNDPLSCLVKDASKVSEGKDKELVTDKENTAPQNSFKVPKLTLSGTGEQQALTESMSASTAASTTASVNDNEKDLRVPRLNLHVTQDVSQSELEHSHKPFQWSVIDDSNVEHESMMLSPIEPKSNNVDSTRAKQCLKQNNIGDDTDAHQQLLASDLAEQEAQPLPPKAWTCENDAVAFELKVTRMGWSQSQRSLVGREVISMSSGTDCHPDMKVKDFKKLLKDHKMSLKSGEVINTDDMVLTTPRELAVGGALDDDKTLGEAGVGPNTPELLLLHTESVRKASCSGKKASPPVSARSTTPRNPGQWLELEQKKLEAQAMKEKELAEQRMKVEAWLKSNGFKDVNELVRKKLSKVRPLHLAVGKGDDEMVRFLLAVGADPRMCNGKSETPYLLAKKLQRNGSLGSAAYTHIVSSLEAHAQKY